MADQLGELADMLAGRRFGRADLTTGTETKLEKMTSEGNKIRELKVEIGQLGKRKRDLEEEVRGLERATRVSAERKRNSALVVEIDRGREPIVNETKKTIDQNGFSELIEKLLREKEEMKEISQRQESEIAKLLNMVRDLTDSLIAAKKTTRQASLPS